MKLRNMIREGKEGKNIEEMPHKTKKKRQEKDKQERRGKERNNGWVKTLLGKCLKENEKETKKRGEEDHGENGQGQG